MSREKFKPWNSLGAACRMTCIKLYLRMSVCQISPLFFATFSIFLSFFYVSRLLLSLTPIPTLSFSTVMLCVLLFLSYLPSGFSCRLFPILMSFPFFIFCLMLYCLATIWDWSAYLNTYLKHFVLSVLNMVIRYLWSVFSPSIESFLSTYFFFFFARN